MQVREHLKELAKSEAQIDIFQYKDGISDILNIKNTIKYQEV